MKKYVLVVLIIIAMASAVFAEDNAYFTRKLFNGRLLDSYHTGKKDADLVVDTYIGGVIDGVNYMNSEAFNKAYPDVDNISREDLINRIVSYYKNNPAKKSRPIAEVVASGCK